MGLLVEITKYAEYIPWHIYEAKGSGIETGPIFVAVNEETKELKFYSDPACTNLLKSLDLSNENAPMGKLPGVKNFVYAIVVVKILKAMKKNIFPNNLSYCA